MARGFESKDVEFQQAELERRRQPPQPMTAEDVARHERRETLRLTLTRLHTELAAARAPAHRRSLEQAIRALDAELTQISE